MTARPPRFHAVYSLPAASADGSVAGIAVIVYSAADPGGQVVRIPLDDAALFELHRAASQAFFEVMGPPA